MNDTEKEQVRERVQQQAAAGALKAADVAKTATGWKKWLYVALTCVLAGLAVFAASGCHGAKVTPEQVQGVHALYHALSGKPCVLKVETVEGK